MTINKKKRFDFFTAYHNEKFLKGASYVLSGIFSLGIAITFVSMAQSGNMRGLMANVANISSPGVYAADIIGHASGSEFSLSFGSYAQQVQSLAFTLVGDPDRLVSVSSQDARLSLSPLAGGMYRGVLQWGDKDIHPGERLSTMSIVVSGEAMINLIDTSFVSHQTEYQLSNVVE